MAGQIIKRSKNSFTVRIFIGRDPETGKRKYLNQSVRGNKKDAQKVLNALLRKKDMGELVFETSRMTVKEYLEHWLITAARPRLRERTFEAYQDMMVRYVYPMLGKKPLPKLSPIEIQELYSGLQKSGLSARTVRYCHSVLNNALQQAVKWRMIYQNPASYVDLPKQQKKEMLALSEEEATLFLKAAKHCKHYVFFATLLGTGMRPSEAFGLQWSDIDFANATLRVQRTVSVSKGGWSFQPPKTKRSRRSITLPDELAKLLLTHQESQEENQLDLVFPNKEGEPLNLRNMTQRYFKPIIMELGISPKMRLYDLRHTHATLLLIAGTHPKIVSERLGHSTISLTLDTYSHVLPGMQAESAEKLNQILFQPSPTQTEAEYKLN